MAIGYLKKAAKTSNSDASDVTKIVQGILNEIETDGEGDLESIQITQLIPDRRTFATMIARMHCTCAHARSKFRSLGCYMCMWMQTSPSLTASEHCMAT